jgi:small-conductance mechanosensitive channel
MSELLPVFTPPIALLLAVTAAVMVASLIRRLLLRLMRNIPGIGEITRRGRYPLRVVLAILAARISLQTTAADAGWYPAVDYLLVLALIASVGWLLIVVLLIVEAAILGKYSTDLRDNRRVRRLKTQIMLARRVAVAAVVTLALASVLLTIDEVRALGAGILASAGIISVVAGLAVQSSLGNVFAGVQLAFTDAIRVDDVVVVEGQWGTIEEITMTYVVVHIWDDRRLILPSTYFTTNPFENWTRRRSEILGTVELDLDWRAPVEQLRSHLHEILAASELWDGRTANLQITEATEGLVRARILVSAADSGSLWDLRCRVRESMVLYLQGNFPEALPRQRWEAVQAPGTAATGGSVSASASASADDDGGRGSRAPAVPGPDAGAPGARAGAPRRGSDDAQLFSGSPEAERRNRHFAGPGEDALAEREEQDSTPIDR